MQKEKIIIKKTKLICCDLDGTLLNDEKNISQYSIEMIKSLKNTDVLFSIATSRPPYLAYRYHHELELSTPIIANSGSMLYDYNLNKCIFKNDVSYSDCVDFLIYGIKNNLDWALLSEKDIFYFYHPERDRIYGEYNKGLAAENRVKLHHINLFCEIEQIFKENIIGRLSVVLRNINDEQLVKAFFKNNKKLSLIHSSEISFDIVAKGVSKQSGIEAICKYYGISLDNVYVFGNDGNDLAMFQSNKNCYAVSNAYQGLKNIAKEIVSGNNDDGVARKIKQLFLDSHCYEK